MYPGKINNSCDSIARLHFSQQWISSSKSMTDMKPCVLRDPALDSYLSAVLVICNAVRDFEMRRLFCAIVYVLPVKGRSVVSSYKTRCDLVCDVSL